MSNCIPLDFLIEYNKKYPNIWIYTEKFQSEKDLWDDTICYFPIGAAMGILQEFYNVPFFHLQKMPILFLDYLVGELIKKCINLTKKFVICCFNKQKIQRI